MGIRDKPIAPRSPWQNGFAERLIGSIRRECVDHVVALGEAHLRRILQAYAGYYNDVRTHRSLDKDAPFSRPVQRIGRVTSHALLGGLHHRYCRILIIAVGFNWAGYGFGWTLRSTAEQKAKDAGDAAIVRVLAPICADKFRQASDSVAKLAALKGTDSWKRDDFIKDTGYATFPGSEYDRKVAEACVELLTQVK